MARNSPKKPSPAKCFKTGASLEGRDWVKIGGHKWLREAAVKEGKFIPIEYREDYIAKNQPAVEATAVTAAETENTTSETEEA